MYHVSLLRPSSAPTSKFRATTPLEFFQNRLPHLQTPSTHVRLSYTGIETVLFAVHHAPVFHRHMKTTLLFFSCLLPPMTPPAPYAADTNINAPTDDEPLSLYKANENLNVALEAAENHGLQVVNIGATDIIQGRPASILGLTWQLIRIHLLAQINLKVSMQHRLVLLILLPSEGLSEIVFLQRGGTVVLDSPLVKPS